MDRDELYRELNELRRDFGNRIGEILDRLKVDKPEAAPRAARPSQWTPERDEILKARWLDPEISVEDLGKLIGLSCGSKMAFQQAIFARRKFLGLPSRPFRVRQVRAAPKERALAAIEQLVATAAQPATEAPPAEQEEIHETRAAKPVEVAGKPVRRVLVHDRPTSSTARLTSEPRPQPVASHLPVATYDETEPVSIETVCTFMRRRDFTVVRTGAGSFVLDSRHKVDTAELLRRANRHRETLKQPPFRLIGAP